MAAPSSPPDQPVAFTTLGGPSLIIEYGSTRFLIDPTFDGPGDHPIGARSLTKTSAAALQPDQVGHIDAVLLSHDQHPDNLDSGGRDFVASAPLVLTTVAAASRLTGNCRGLRPFESVTVNEVTVTAVPAQHGPDGTETLTGPVIGFVLETPAGSTIYVSGDNASLDIVRQVAERFPSIDVAVLFAGGARTPLVEGFLTLTSTQAVDAVRLLGNPRVLPVHTDGWAHFTESGAVLREAFASAGSTQLLLDSTPGRRVEVNPPGAPPNSSY